MREREAGTLVRKYSPFKINPLVYWDRVLTDEEVIIAFHAIANDDYQALLDMEPTRFVTNPTSDDINNAFEDTEEIQIVKVET